MKNKILSIVLILAILGTLLTLTGCGKKNEVIEKANDAQIVEQVKEETFIDKYAKYLEENVFLENTQEVNGTLIDVENDNEPELLIKYNNEGNIQISIISIKGDEIIESEKYSDASIRVLYDVANAEPDYYLETKTQDYRKATIYLLISDIIKEKTEIAQIEKNEKFKYTYIESEADFDMYSIKKDSVQSDLERLNDKYETEEIFTEEEKTEIEAKITEINNNTLKSDANGVYNSKNEVNYGKYVWGDDYLIINSDNSARYVHQNVGNGFDLGGSFKLVYNEIVFDNSRKFKIIGDNQLQDSNGNIFNLEK